MELGVRFQLRDDEKQNGNGMKIATRFVIRARRSRKNSSAQKDTYFKFKNTDYFEALIRSKRQYAFLNQVSFCAGKAVDD